MNTTQTATITVLQVEQGHCGDLRGVKLSDAVAQFTKHDSELRQAHPTWAVVPVHRVIEVRESDRCPWGRCWWKVEPDGALSFYQEHYDSSG